MCEYCGCQAVPAIARFTAEHDTIVNIMGEVRADLRYGRHEAVVAGCRRILDVLEPHTRVEEQGLFPPMQDEFGDQCDALRAEHRSIEAVLAEAATRPTDPGWPRRLVAALADLREHILKEQNGVFPASLAILAPEDWDCIDALQDTPAS